jgi:hypothetical protein
MALLISGVMQQDNMFRFHLIGGRVLRTGWMSCRLDDGVDPTSILSWLKRPVLITFLDNLLEGLRLRKRSFVRGRKRQWVSSIASLMIAGLTPIGCYAYTAAGDRNFPANLLLPQIAPSDAIWINFQTQPIANGSEGQIQVTTPFTGTYSKTITEQFGIQLEDGITRQGRVWGAPNFDLLLQYEAINDQPHEFILSVQVDHEFGGSGSGLRVGSLPQSATQPGITFGKGLGDLPIGYWRPLAITGVAQFQIAQGEPPPGQMARPNKFSAGFSVQYSIPYLLSKVENIEMPQFFRHVTPMVELLYTTPVGSAHNHDVTVQVAPGFSYSQGRGWELGVEALIPATKATATGLGVFGQVVIQLDYLMPRTFLGRPIFPLRELQ